MRRFLITLAMFGCCLSATLAGQAPYRVTFSGVSPDVPWLPFEGTRLQNVPWTLGTLIKIPTPNQPMPLFGFTVQPADSVEVYISGNGSFLISTPAMLALADGVFITLDSTVAGAMIGYRNVITFNDPMLQVRFDSVSIADLGAPNVVSFEIHYHFNDGAIDLLFGPSSENTRLIANPQARPFTGISLQANDFSEMFSKVWIYGDPASPRIDTARTVAFPAMNGVPTPGSRIHFEPLAVTGVEEDQRDERDAWVNASVNVYDIMGRLLTTTVTTSNGTLNRDGLFAGPVVVINTATHKSKLLMIE
ncbi:MAG: hypothetical protein NTX15_03585 [Candidatus Kapabacteria bacterium]|nr:hypothetical protein [Candidatus Kapabacteria bacterium]